MALVKRTNNGSFPTFRSLISDLFDTEKFFENEFLTKEWVPAVNIKENGKNYTIEVAAPGMTKKDFQVNIENNLLTISAEKQEEKKEERDNYTRQEFSYNSFSRSFTLPENANSGDIKAKYEDGILKLDIAKKKVAATASKKVAVE